MSEGTARKVEPIKPVTPQRSIISDAGIADLAPGSYILFADVNAFDFDALENSITPDFPGVELRIVPIRTYNHKTVADCVALYKIDDDTPKLLTDATVEVKC